MISHLALEKTVMVRCAIFFWEGTRFQQQTSHGAMKVRVGARVAGIFIVALWLAGVVGSGQIGVDWKVTIALVPTNTLAIFAAWKSTITGWVTFRYIGVGRLFISAGALGWKVNTASTELPSKFTPLAGSPPRKAPPMVIVPVVVLTDAGDIQ